MTLTPEAGPADPAGPVAAERPLRRDAERNRRRILAAARELFAERGLETTLDDIARHAELGIGTVYRRFPSREHLVEALFEEKIDHMVTRAEGAAAQADSWTALVDFLIFTIEALATDRGLYEIMVSSTYGRDRIAASRERLGPVVGQLVARAQADGHLRADIEMTDIALIQMMIGAVAEYSRQTDPRLWRRYLTILLDGLRPRRDGPTPLPRPALAHTDLDEAMRTWRPARR
ncbi:TetR/AcrR family transcriptional regulator [Parafrankia discariae]|uniref:TetR/AcrR family transcriptional regulator n=1 Tax=Parafrankia discariae TaxID=365528 RepID=UPI0003746F95|nr:TetR/AcrR family transcriptional regulator [Parafrankia discariae]